ncbi:MAG: AraC family transcriptional regulator [Oscillospiraceae bacterium]|nr:AraC family transcriptional regulator [Oscillospiraceae bacterium]
MDVLTQLNRAMDYVEAHICDDMALADVSSATVYSTYHFGRMFYYIADMPLSEYIRRRKLSLAAMDLQCGDAKVIDLAVKYGYDSADSFTRAFVRQHGVTPSVARKTGVMLKIFPPLTFQIKIGGVHEMNWRIEQKEAFEVCGIERYFKPSVWEDGDVPPLSPFWDEIRENGSLEKLIKHVGRNDLMAICCHDDGGNRCRDENNADDFPYMICLPCECGGECSSDGFTTATVPKSTWAVFRESTVGYGLEIPRLFQRALSEWLPSSGYDRAPGPDMEIYGSEVGGKLFDEVWIPVVKR